MITGLLFVPIGLLGLGVAMVGALAFGRRCGLVSIALGAGALGSVYATLISSDPSIASSASSR